MFYRYHQPLTSGDMERLDQAVFRLLSKTGLKVENDELLQAAERFGFQVDHDDQRVRFPEQLMRQVIADVASTYAAACEKSGRPKVPVPSHEYKLGLGNYTPFIYDRDTHTRRSCTKQDLIDAIYLGNALPEVTGIGLPLTLGDVDQRIESIESAAILGLHSEKAGLCTDIYTVEQMPYLCEISQILHGHDRGYFHKIRDINSPLILGRHAAAILVEQLKRGWYSAIGTMPVAGANAPMSLAGTVALALAEVFGGFGIIKAFNPDVGMHGSPYPGILDMATGCATFCAPESYIINVNTHLMMRDFYGVRAAPCNAYNTIARVPGMQAVYEKTFTQFVFAGIANVPLEHGILDSGRVYSASQFMLDLEFNQGICRFFQGLQVDDDSLAIEVIEEICEKGSNTFIEADHTLDHVRDFWTPQFLDRAGKPLAPTWAEGEQELLDKADAKWRRILADYTPPEIDEDKQAAVEAVVERARRDLLT